MAKVFSQSARSLRLGYEEALDLLAQLHRLAPLKHRTLGLAKGLLPLVFVKKGRINRCHGLDLLVRFVA